MTRWLVLLSALCLSSASANLFNNLAGGLVGDIAGTAVKEVAAVIDPVEKIATKVMFGQCKEIKEALGLDHKNIQDDRNLSSLTIDLFTKSGKATFELTELHSITSSKLFKPNEGLIIFFHGFIDNPDQISSATVVNNFIERGTGNILALDASPIIGLMYLRSSTLVKHIGEQVGNSLALMITAGLDPSAIHLVGHSLGSHIAGFAGKTVQYLTKSHVGRISALDPAGPCFGDVDKTQRLSKNDASYVDVIHTDGGVLGLEEPIGHADYYPNGGTEQPGCMFQVCSHDRAWLYYSMSLVIPQGFPAIRCPSWKHFQEGNCGSEYYFSEMGYESQPGTEGKFYLQTDSKYPYALGLKGVEYTNTEGIVKTFRNSVGL